MLDNKYLTKFFQQNFHCVKLQYKELRNSTSATMPQRWCKTIKSYQTAIPSLRRLHNPFRLKASCKKRREKERKREPPLDKFT